MSTLLRKGPARSQPQQRTFALDRSGNLVVAWSGDAGRVNQVDNGAPLPPPGSSSSGSFALGPQGTGRLLASATALAHWRACPSWGVGRDVTFACIYTPDAAAITQSDNRIIGAYSSTLDKGFGLWFGTADGKVGAVFPGVSGHPGSVIQLVAGQAYFLAISFLESSALTQIVARNLATGVVQTDAFSGNAWSSMGPTDPGRLAIGDQPYAGGAGATGHWAMAACWLCVLPVERLLGLAANPWQIFKPAGRALWVEAPAAGNFSASVTETAAATHANAASMASAAAVTETAAATHANAATLAAAAAVTETAAATEVSNATATGAYNATVTETAAATEASSGTYAATAAATETAAATHANAATLAATGAVTETAAATHVNAGTLAAAASVVETAAATQTAATTFAPAAAIVETAAATEASNASSPGTFNAAATETAAATEVTAATATKASAIVETMVGADACNGVRNTFAACLETATPIEVSSADVSTAVAAVQGRRSSQIDPNTTPRTPGPSLSRPGASTLRRN